MQEAGNVGQHALHGPEHVVMALAAGLTPLGILEPGPQFAAPRFARR